MKGQRLLSLLLCLALGLAALLSGCGTDEPGTDSPESERAEYPVTIFGAVVTSRPGRIVSLSPSLTEKLYDMGIQERLVGVSDFCDFPAEAAELPACGIAQTPKLNAIIELNAHVVLSETPLSEDAIITLQQKGIDVVVLPRASTVDGLLANYRALYRLTEGEYGGEELSAQFTARLSGALTRLRTAVSQTGEPAPTVLYLRLMDFTVATGDTLENELLKTLGVENIAAGYTDWTYPASAAEAAGRPDFEALNYYFMDDKYVDIHDLEQSAFYKGLQATLKDRFLYIDMDLFERQSLRMFPELWRMAEYLYPDADIPPWESAFAAPIPAETGDDLPEQADGDAEAPDETPDDLDPEPPDEG